MKDQLENNNIFALLIQSMVGLTLLSLPREIATHAENNGWASVLVGGGIAFFTGYSFYWLAVQFPKLNFSEIVLVVLGKYLGRIQLIGISIFTITSLGFSLNSFAVSVKQFLLDRTPLYVIIAVMMLMLFYGVAKGIKTISITFDLLLPVILMAITTLILFSTTTMEPMNLLPVWAKGPMPILKGTLPLINPFSGTAMLGYVLPYFRDIKKTKKCIGISIFVTIIIYLAIITMSIMVFGSQEIKQLIYPTISLSKTIRLKTEIFERMESLFMTVWIPISYTTMLTQLWVATLNSKALFNTKKDHIIMLIHIPILIFFINLPKNVVELSYYLSLTRKFSYGLTLVGIPVVLIATLIYKRRAKKNEKG